MQSSGSSSQASSCAIDTAKSGAARALILSIRPPTSPTKYGSKGMSLFRTPLAHQGLISVPTNILSNHSCPKPPIPPVQPTAHSRPRLRLPIQILNLMAAARSRPPTSTLSITTPEVRLSRSLLAVLVLQNSLHPISVDLKVNLLSLSPLLAVPTAPTPLTGDRDLAPPPVNRRSGTSSRFIPHKISLRGPVSQGDYLIVNFSFHHLCFSS